ncbi:MAG: cation-transporting P-type ATPase [Cyanobacteria bacterium J06632_22]
MMLSQQWHTCSISEALIQLSSDATQGLDDAEATARLAQYGPNELKASAGRSRLRILWDQFSNVMLLMLIGVAVVSGVLDWRAQVLPKDAIAIFAIVLLNALLGYLQESRAEQALQALKALSSPDVRVIRAGQTQVISANGLVPGDVVLLEAGDQVAADGRLVTSASLQVRESALTGEATAVSKQAQDTLAPDTPLADRKNLVFQGTEVVNGRGQMVVTATGMATELGKIAELIQGVEPEATPLQRRMGQLGNWLVGGSLSLVALVVSFGTLALGWNAFEELLTVSLSMAVAVVPEGLPAVITVTLALGTQRMVQRQALIRRLPAVETLGSVTTICSDKTGTLTQNKMVVQSVQSWAGETLVTGQGYLPMGDLTGAPLSARLLQTCVLCNDAALQKENGDWAIMGDPTEGALLTLAGKAGYFASDLSQRWQRIGEVPFSSERKRMSVVVQPAAPPGTTVGDKILLLVKGSPEVLLAQCDRIEHPDIQQHNHVLTLDRAVRSQLLEASATLASQGKRVLGLAYRTLDSLPPETALESAEQNLIWLGLVAMADAIRPEVQQAVAQCLQAGIRPVMITGDHPLTARAIAAELGLQAEPVITGTELEAMPQEELEWHVQQTSVYARVSPEHKLRIVQALQTGHQIVAMTGDGVNDAPALKQAEIGIAMGITGTDVSKEASDMVLLDDNFTSIVAAAEEGRVVYSNIRKFVKYILGSNIGEVITIALSPLLLSFGGAAVVAVPLTPLQILWMNLVTDGFPALALAMEPPEPNMMDRPPHDPKESIFARGLGFYMVRVGIVFAILAISLMLWAYGYTHSDGIAGNPERWKTMVFTMLCLSQMGHAISVRSPRLLAYQMSPWSNPYVLFAVIATSILQLLLIYVPALRSFFGTQYLAPIELAVCVGFSLLLFVWLELEKLFLRAKRQ